MRAFFAAPVYPDEDPTRAAAKLSVVVWTLALAVPIVGAAGLALQATAPLRLGVVILSVEAAALGSSVLNRAGQTRRAGLLLTGAMWLVVTGYALTGGGLQSIAVWAYAVIVFLAGVVIDNRAGLVAAAVCSLTVLGLAYTALTGLLPLSSVGAGPPLNLWLINTLYLAFAAGLQYVASLSMSESLQQARHELAERQRIEKALRESEARFRAVFEHAAIGMALNDPDGHLLQTNAASQAFLGYTSAEMARLSFTDLTHPDDVAQETMLYHELMSGQRDAYKIEKRYLRKDGAEVWGRLTVSLVRDAAGAPQFAIAMSEDISEQKRAEAALQQYTARMETLHEIDRDILAARSVADTTRAAVGNIRRLVNCERAGVIVLDPQSQSGILGLAASQGDEPRAVVEMPAVRLDDDYVQRILKGLRQGQAVNIEDLDAIHGNDPTLDAMRGFGLRSWLHLPLRSGDDVIGVLNLARAKPGRFSEADQEVAQDVADQLAIAIRQARLLEETREALQREQRVNEVARTISGTLDWATVVQTIMRLAAEAVGASGSLVGLLTAKDEVEFFPSFFNAPGDGSPGEVPANGLVHETIHRGDGLVWQLIETRQAMLLDHYGEQPGALPYLVRAGVHALVAAPIIAGENALGGLAVFERDPQRRFSPRDRDLIVSIASQAGLAIQNARLYEAERSARLQADALVKSAQAITSTLSLPEVVQRILSRVQQVIPAVTGAVLTRSADDVTVLALLGYEGREAGVRQTLQDRLPQSTLVQRVYQEGRPILIPDVRANPDWVAYPETGNIRCVLAMPIIGRAGVLGILFADSDKVGAFTEQHQATVRALADQAAIAIENAQLFEATRRQVSELVVLHAGALAASEAASEGALIEQTTRIIGDNLYSTFCGVALVDAERRVVRPHRSHLGITGEQNVRFEVALGQGVVGTVALNGRPWRIPDVRLEPRYVAAVPGMLSELCVPLKAGERVIGTINVESERVNAFSPADERLLVTYAGLLATAIVRLRAEAESRALNEQLEQRVVARTRELSALFDVSEIASQLLDLPTMVSQALARVLEAVHSRSGAVFLLGDWSQAASERLIGLTVQHGLDPALVAELEQTAAAGLMAEVIRQGRPVIWPEPIGGDLACVGLPMNVSGTAVGVLSAFRAFEQPFNVEELSLLASTADALALAVETLRLRQQAEQTAVAFERERLARDLHDSVTQALYSLTLFAEAGRRLVRTPGSTDTLEHYLMRLGETARQALKDMRLLIHNLRPTEFSPNDLIGALRQRLDAVERRSGVDASLTVESVPAISAAAAEALYRIAQEALNNALKHSEATTVRVRLYNDDSHSVLVITDNGHGFVAGGDTDRGGMGLRNMQSRARELNGTCSIRSELGVGTVVVVTVPHGGA